MSLIEDRFKKLEGRTEAISDCLKHRDDQYETARLLISDLRDVVQKIAFEFDDLKRDSKQLHNLVNELENRLATHIVETIGKKK